MKKWLSLCLVGVVGFIAVFLLLLFFQGFFNRALPSPCAGASCPSQLPDDAMVVQQLVIEGSSISPGEILLSSGKIMALTLVNMDGESHKLLWLKKAGGDYEIAEQVFAEPGGERAVTGFFFGIAGFKEEKYTVSLIGDRASVTGQFSVIKAAPGHIISCATCTGENSQVKVILEE